MKKNKDLVQDYPDKGIKVGKLNTLENIRNEMSRLYRAARRASGPLPDASTAAKLAYLLNHIGKSIESVDLEKRIKDIEQKIGSSDGQKGIL